MSVDEGEEVQNSGTLDTPEPLLPCLETRERERDERETIRGLSG